jgi:hypothetical protein
MRSRVFVTGACLMVAVIVSGCATGAVSPDIQTGRADVNAAGDGGSITTSDWTYGLPTEGVNWVDAEGTFHDGGRPECLAPGTSTEVRFAAVNVEVDGQTWRPVVWISCQ